MTDQDTLDVDDAPDDPLELFARWYGLAQSTVTGEPTAMTLATVGRDGRPTARMVLLKGFDTAGFVFYTNFSSRKAAELGANPYAALLFWWPPQMRQVRVEGRVHTVDDSEADAYFATRPRGSQIGAWASPQSEPLIDRADLENRVASVTARFAGETIPRPPFWGGYRLAADTLEFWQGRADRLHDRVSYRRGDGTWHRTRLAP